MRTRVLRALCLAVEAAALCLGTGALAACTSTAASSARPTPAGPPHTVMIVGDSISQGLEGDVTWRYDLAKVEAGKVPGFTYVGPWSGTYMLPPHLPANWPTVPAPPYYDGAYAAGESFADGGDSQHDSRWGMTLAEATSGIQATVREYQPGYLLVMLGFDDLAWGTGSPSSVQNLVPVFVSAARAARPSIRILFANVVQRAPISSDPTMPATISAYDHALADTLANLSTPKSPVELVNVASSYYDAADTYDGVHPNNVGEWVIADAFANALARDFGFGKGSSYLPGAQLVKIKPAAKPTLKVDAAGIYASWPHVYGAAGYRLNVADLTKGQTLGRRTVLPSAVVGDSWQLTWLVPGHRYEIAVQAIRGYQTTPWSAPATARANPQNLTSLS
jgi:lysophospholipase L1-like esterase